MTDAEPPAGPEEADSTGGFASVLNSTPKLIGAITSGGLGLTIDSEDLYEAPVVELEGARVS